MLILWRIDTASGGKQMIAMILTSVLIAVLAAQEAAEFKLLSDMAYFYHADSVRSQFLHHYFALGLILNVRSILGHRLLPAFLVQFQVIIHPRQVLHHARRSIRVNCVRRRLTALRR